MAKIIGTVENIPTMVLGSGVTMYRLQVNGQRYGNGSNQPPCNVGDTVEFDTFTNAKGYETISRDSIRVVQAPAQATPAPKGGAKKEVDWDSKDARISYQAAYNSAVQTVKGAFEVGALSIPAKTPAGEKLGLFRSMVDSVAADLFCRYMATNSETAGNMAQDMEMEAEGDPNDWPDA